jgi:phosphate/sulfate permease
MIRMEKHWSDNPRKWQWWIVFILIIACYFIFGLMGTLIAGVIFALFLWLIGRKKEAKELVGGEREWGILFVVLVIIVAIAVIILRLFSLI